MNKTMKLWNAGYSKQEALTKGVDALLWCEYEDVYGHASIPLNVLLGFKARPPYSCEFHAGVASQQLKQVIKDSNASR